MRRASLTNDSIVEMTSGVDITTLDLQRDEAYLLSRIPPGRRMKVSEVISIAGMPPDNARSTLERLVLKRTVVVRELRGPRIDDDEYEGFIFPASAMSEPADLSDEQKKRILFVEAKLGEWNHYALLGLKRTASSNDVKGAFRAASKEFHPDAYFRKNIGSFKGRVDKIFRAMKAASDVLSDVEKRAAYDQEVVVGFTPEELRELDALAAAEKEKQAAVDRDRRVEERLKERRLQRNPMVERLHKSREFLKLAEGALAGGKHAEAARHAKMAAEYANLDEKIKSRATEIAATANAERARTLVRRVDQMISTLDASALADAGEELATLAPKDAEVLAAAAKLLKAGGRPSRAIRIAQQAVGVNGRHKDALEVLYNVARDEKNWNTALRAAEGLMAVDPKNATYKDWVKAAKRNV